jgi:hypothetical protein
MDYVMPLLSCVYRFAISAAVSLSDPTG